ncbi:MAG: hypothetical protein MUF58_10015 [Arcicella sp.]|jgi:hypothetical protein|nr:hypothetical protein [Arcicella sp.]
MKSNETILSKEEILRIRGAYTAKYGIVPDDSLTCLLCEMSDLKKSITQSTQTFQVNSFWSAFALGLGRFGVAAILFFTVVFLFMYRNYYGSLERKEKYLKVNTMLQKFDNVSDFEDFIKDSKRITNPNGLPKGKYLLIKVTRKLKNQMRASTEGIIKADSTVYIPLFFEQEPK